MDGHFRCGNCMAYDSSGMQSKKIFGSLYEPILMINKNAKNKYTFNAETIMIEAKTGAQKKYQVMYRSFQG